MRRLFLINTPYQLIVSTLLSAQLQKSYREKNDLIITDNFLNSKRLFHKVIASGYYNEVYYARINDYLFSKKKVNNIKKIIFLFFYKYILKKNISPFMCFKYDEIYYNNDDLFLYNLVSLCAKYNNNIKVYRFEEGYSSYLNAFCSLKSQYLCSFRDWLKRNKSFKNVFNGAYFYEPQLVMYNMRVPLLKLNREITNKLKSVIISFFDLEVQYCNIREKYVIFEESFFQDIGYNQDLKLYKKITEIVGKENVLVKMHPRSKVDRFSPIGVKTLINDGVPWEVVLLSGNVHDKIFVSMASGSIINARLLFGDFADAWLLYKCTEDRIPLLNQKFERFINNLNKKSSQRVRVLGSYSELVQLLNEQNV